MSTEPESQDPDAVMSDGERGYQAAIDHIRGDNADAFWTFAATHPDGEDPSSLPLLVAAFLEARRGDEPRPDIRAGLEREIRAKVAAELRAALTAGNRPPWAVVGTADRAASVAEWAARIAEGGDTNG